jgi:DNA topoisomerase-3
MAEIVEYASGTIRTEEEATIDATRLGDCPRCGRPVIEGKCGFGCSGWKEGCSGQGAVILQLTDRERNLP